MSKDDLKQMQTKVAKWTDPDNPFRQFLNRIADKWVLLVIIVLLYKPKNRCRFSELKAAIPGISQRMLTITLRNLCQDGLVIRHFYSEIPPRVEYELSEFGKSIRAPLKNLFDWLSEKSPTARKFREKYTVPPT